MANVSASISVASDWAIRVAQLFSWYPLHTMGLRDTQRPRERPGMAGVRSFSEVLTYNRSKLVTLVTCHIFHSDKVAHLAYDAATNN